MYFSYGLQVNAGRGTGGLLRHAEAGTRLVKRTGPCYDCAMQAPDKAATPTSDPAQPSQPQQAASTSRGITMRAVLIGLPLMLANALWITVVEVRWYTLDGTSLPLFITPVFFLFLLCVANFGLRRLSPRKCLDQGELLTVYVMLVIGSVAASHDLYQNLFGAIAHADRFATPESRYESVFFDYLKPLSFLLVRDETAIKGFYQGGVTWYRPEYLVPFLLPLLWWGLFISVLIGMCLCINILIRRAWTDNEKLAFPIVQLPMAMTNPDRAATPFWRSRMMWAGFALAATIDFINGMHYLVPSWPYLEQVKQYDIGRFFTQRPWSAVGYTPISMYPFAIGLAYFLPLDLAFSCWFFYVARKAFQIVGATAGWDAPSNVGFPFFEQQSSGAWIALGGVVIWSLRAQFRDAWRIAFGRRDVKLLQHTPAMAESDRNLYRAAFLGLAAGTLFLCWFSWRLQMTFWVAAAFFGLFFLLAIAITRVRAEFGTPHEIYFVSPRTVLVTLFGVNVIGAQNLTALSVLYWFNRGYRCHPMPNQLEAFKMAEGGRMQRGRLIALIIVITIVATLMAYWANLYVTFNEGATGKAVGFKRWVGSESYDRLNGWLQTPTKPDRTQIGYVIGGAIVVLGLRVMRGAFLWWPFHPAGYALAVSYAMDYFWFAFFISWLIKLIIVRFGGMRAHNGGIPFFLGLVLGDYVAGSIWGLYGPINGLQSYKIYI